jgi:regulator of protease activity HflC (stomatin/prohibitin superfamily)
MEFSTQRTANRPPI